MKRVISIVIAAVLLGCFSFNAIAQSDKKFNKEMEKVYKNKSKELKKQKWQISGSSLTLDAALMKHLRTVNSDDKNKEIVAEVSMCKSANVCKQNALNNALVEYANTARTFVSGKTVSDMFNNSSAAVPEEFDKFYGAYERRVAEEINGVLEFSFAIEKPNGAGKMYRAYYIVNEDKASQARIRAMQRAAKETNLAQEYANKVSDFVRAGFE